MADHLSRSVCRLSPDQFGQMMIQSVRYALGRRTTAPTDTKAAVICAWSAIPAEWKAIIDRDVRGEIERAERIGETVGDQCDHDTWTDLVEWLDEIRQVDARRGNPW